MSNTELKSIHDVIAPAPWTVLRAPSRVPGARELAWESVRIEHIAVGPAGDPQRAGMRLVRAIVHLAGLAPADVRVLVQPLDALPGDRASEEPIARLWSTHPLANGSYVFEASVPASRLTDPGRLKVHVGPAQLGGTSSFAPAPGCWRRLPAPTQPGAGTAWR